ncbi:cell wall hydrolase [Clostridiaceae bacterium M8S5]|nr:cell wall hydrolase [Clostridiaceae bacterium M8S5]
MRKILALLALVCVVVNTSYSLGNSYVMHTARDGDTYWKVANQYGIGLTTIQNLNQSYGDMLYEGKLIRLKSSKQNIKIKIDGKSIWPKEFPYLESSRVHLPIRTIADALKADEIKWDEKNSTAIIMKDGKKISLPLYSDTAYINNKKVKLDAPINVYSGRTFVPLRFLCEVFGVNVGWDQHTYTAHINTNKAYDDEYGKTHSEINNSDDLYWLSRIVHAESQGESYQGKLAVANVILNRVKSSDFPNTIKGVVFEKTSGYYQFSPVLDGSIYNTPSQESTNAAKEALSGNNNIRNCTYFLNPDKAKNFWIVNNKTFYKSIGLHDFYM